MELPEEVQKPPHPNDAKGAPYVKLPQTNCLLEYAEKTGSVEACELITEFKFTNNVDKCFEVIAEINSDPSICENLTGPASWNYSVS